MSIAPNIKFAYGVGDYLIYSADDNYFIYDFSTSTSTSLEVDGRRFISRLIETEKAIYFLPQINSDTRLYKLSKEDYSVNEISKRVYSIVDLIDKNGNLYFSEPDISGLDLRLYEYDTSTESITQITSFERADIETAAFYDGKVHIIGRIGVSVASGGGRDYLSLINEGVLDTIKQVSYLNSSIDPIITTLGDKLYFSDGTDELGIELYSLDYIGVNTKNEVLTEFEVYPNPTDGQVYFEETVDQVKIFNYLGQFIEQHSNCNSIILDEAGVYYLTIKLKNGLSTIQKIINL